jgi:hypothetical protein
MPTLRTFHVETLVELSSPRLRTMHVEVLVPVDETIGPPEPPLRPASWLPAYVWLGEFVGWRPLFPRQVYDDYPPVQEDWLQP